MKSSIDDLLAKLADEKALKVQQVMEVLNASEIKVLGLIESGDLPASNINTKPNAQRPQWRILPSDVFKFLAKTRHIVDQPAKPKRVARKTATKDYFAEAE